MSIIDHTLNKQSGYISEHWNPVPHCYSAWAFIISEHDFDAWIRNNSLEVFKSCIIFPVKLQIFPGNV